MGYLKKLNKNIYLTLALILFILPFPSAFFFEEDILYVEWFIFIVFFIFALGKNIHKQKLNISSALSIIVTLLPIAYLLPLIFGTAANKTASFNYFIRYIAYFFIFMLARYVVKDNKNLKVILYILALSGLICGILGIDAIGGEKIIHAFKLTSISFEKGFDRLYGIFKYPNASAIYYGAVFFIMSFLILLNNNKIFKSIISGLMVIMLTVTFFTISRGAILTIGMVYIALLILLPKKENKIEFLLTTIAPIVAALILYQPLRSASPTLNPSTGSTLKVWIITLLAIVISSAICYGLEFIIDRLNKISSKIYIILLIILAVLLIVGCIILFTTDIYKKIIPEAILQRFNLKGNMATSGRTDFYKDAIKLLKDNWLLGTGGGGWEALYRMYQSYSYGSTEVHSMILQIGIETGILGILLYIALIIFSIIAYFKSLINKENSLAITFFVAIAGLLIGHSMVDFNFSYFSIPCLVFFILGCIDGLSLENYKDYKFKLPLKVSVVLGFIPLFIASSFIIARLLQKEAKELINTSVTETSLTQAANKLKFATYFNPINIDYYIDEDDNEQLQNNLVSIYAVLFEWDMTSREFLSSFEKSAKKALWLNSSNPNINSKIGKYYIQTAIDNEYGLECLEKALKYDPLNPIRYEDIALNYFDVSMSYLKAGQEEEGKKYLERIKQLTSEIEQINQSLAEEIKLTIPTLEHIIRADDILDSY